jgi:hypothetical protein
MAGSQGLDDEDFLDRTEPLDTFQQEFSRRNADVKQLGTSVYRECWVEFYRWEPGACRQLIVDLPPTSSDSDSTDCDDWNDVPSSDKACRDQSPFMDVDSLVPQSLVTVVTYSKDGSFCQTQVPLEEVTVVTTLAPHPVYESCPPTSKNIARRFDDLDEYEQALFIPYADEQEFNAIDYTKEIKLFSWQVDWKDPDRKTSPSSAVLPLTESSGGHSA